MRDCPLKPGASVWGYGRDSGGEHQDKSVSDQRRAIDDYCEVHGLVHVRFFADEARRGSLMAGRDGLDDMRALAHRRPRPVDGVVCWDFSRIFRGFDTAQWIKGELRSLGYAVISITDDVPDGPVGRLVEAAYDWKNEEELRRLSVNVRRGLHELARDGYAPGGVPPRGYREHKVFIGHRRRKHGDREELEKRFARRWNPDPEWASRVSEAFALRAQGVGVSLIAGVGVSVAVAVTTTVTTQGVSVGYGV